MSFRAQAWAEEITGLPWATKGILLLLANRHNGETGQCNPSETWLCERTELSARAIRMHLKALEDAGLIERLYEHGGRGVGRSVAGFHLKIGIMGAVTSPEKTFQKDTHSTPDIATAKSCHGKLASLPRQNIAKPYKEEPERTGVYVEIPENREIADAFDAVWSVWSSRGRKRSPSKAKCYEVFRRKVKGRDINQVRKACLMFAKTTDGEYHPSLERWLRDEKFENWYARTPQQLALEQPAAPSSDQVAAAVKAYIEFELWDRQMHGPAPHELGCRLPQNWLAEIASRLGDRHRFAAPIIRHLEAKGNVA